MAGAASSSSSSENYDVFLSFRGEDTRRSFVSHLYTALLHKQIRTYKDNITLEKGDEVWPALVRAIENSYICIVVFSKDYASSTWCLKELTHILDCKQEGEIIPVFYEIEPTHLRHQTGSYKKAFKEYEKELDEETVSKWKASLKKGANFSGFDSQSTDYSDESNFIDEIVKKVLQKLRCKYPPNELPGLIGIEEKIRSIESLLQEAQTIGIWGMGGIGKTTLARAVFNKLSRQYDGCCFLANVREESGKHGLDHLRKQLLSELLDGKNITEEETSLAMSRLKRKKVFIVLDDADDSEQLEHLIRDYDCLGSDSRLIVTTRDKQILISKGVQEIYRVHTLQSRESIKLFGMNAFGQNHLEIGFEELTRKAIDYAGGIPLALKVLGSSLRSQSIKTWESALGKLEKHPNVKIQKVLRLSYDGLDCTEKKIFLDIVFFFKGADKDRVTSILDACDFFAGYGIETLINRALITLDCGGRIHVHDLIEEMGKAIVREESNNEPGKYSRLWDPKDIYDVLQHNKGSDSIEGIILDMSWSRDLRFNADTFTKMCNLRFFKFYVPWCWYNKSCKVDIPSHSKLIFNKPSYFQWDACPLQSLSQIFCPERLVELHMPDSHVEKLWDGVQDTVNLRIINLWGSKRLREFPNLSNASNLECIDLGYCENLRSVDLSNLCLPKLNYLRLYSCVKLKSLLSETPLESLKTLFIKLCSSLKEFSLSSEEIKELDLSKTAIEILPSSIGKCSKLKRLYLPVSLKNLPNELSNLKSLRCLGLGNCRELEMGNLHIILDGLQSLEQLDLSGCLKLESLLSEAPLKHLYVKGCSSLKEFSLSSEEIMELDLSETAIKILPPSIGKCSKLESLYLPVSLKNLPNELSKLRSLRRLGLGNCRELDTGNLHIILDGLQFLEQLDLRGCLKLESLRSEASLEHLNVKWCSSLKEFSLSSEEIMELDLSKTAIKILPSSIGKCSKLERLYLPASLKSLPNELSKLRSLRSLGLGNCRELETGNLHIILDGLQSLKYLSLRGCLKLESLLSEAPLKYLNVAGCSSLKEFSLNSEEIMELDLSETTIKILPSSIGKCSKLKSLYLPISLKNLPNELSKLTSLQELVLGNCKELDTGNLHIILDGLQSLKKLDLSGCCNLSHFPHNLGTLSRLEMLALDGSSVESLPASITHLSQLRTLSLQYCKKLQHLPKLPTSFQLLKANNCISLETVSTSMELKVGSCQMDFQNCVKLDQDSLFHVQACLDFLIKQREAFDLHFSSPCFKACFPGNKIPRCFLCRATQRWITIEIPACFDLTGFTFCIIISPDIMPQDSAGFIISCECHFANEETVKFQYISKPDPNEVYFDPGIVGMVSEHVYLWCENYYFMGTLNNTEEKANDQCTNFNQKVFIEFSFYVTNGAKTMKMNQMIKECGVRPILNNKEQSLDLNMDIKTD